MNTLSPSFARLALAPIFAFVGLWMMARSAVAAELADLWRERLKSVVAVEFYTENELDRQATVTYGTVIDREGTIILHPGTIDLRVPPSRLKAFRIYRPGKPVNDYAEGEYLGFDAYTGWHFVRAPQSLRGELRPITDFAVGTPAEPPVGVAVWGIGLRGKDEDFVPYLMASVVSVVRDLPQHTGFALNRVAGPNLPVFTGDGAFVGLGVAGYGETYLQYSRNERGSSLLLISPDEANVFRLASEVLPNVGRVPRSPSSRPLAWLGVHGLQPVGAEVAQFLKLQNQSALVVSEVLEDSPAEKAGLQERDIVVGFEGSPLPRLKPDPVVAGWLEREVARRLPGDEVKLSVLRGTEKRELTVTLGDEPKNPREAEHVYFDRLGFTAREFLYGDAVSRHVKQDEREGVVASFVKTNGAANTAGLRHDDWIRELDGVPIKTFAEAVEKLRAIENDPTRGEFVALTSRGGETAVIRVKLK
jgi:serine protease Do